MNKSTKKEEQGMRNGKKITAILVTLAMCLTSVIPTFASSDTPKKSDATLEIAVTWTDENLASFQAVLDQYTEETGVQFDVTAPGEDYETQLKVRMGSNDMPDLWITHGWSVLRYKEYLTNLSNESWSDKVSDAAKGIVADDDGSIYVLPISIALSGICFNKDVLEKAGVDWTKMANMNEFEAACTKIRDAGFSPIIMGGKDNGNLGSLLNALLFINFANPDSPNHDVLNSLLDGTANITETWSSLFDTFLKWRDENFFNQDYMTMDTVGGHKMLGGGTGAFFVKNTQQIAAALSYYPEANLGLTPYPSLEENGRMSMAVTEGTCFGIWKDTKYMDEAKAFLEWLAKPEIASQFFAFDGATAGLTDTPDDSLVGKLYQEVLDAYGEENIYFDNIFDRKYLPNGMWNSLSEGSAMLVNDTEKEEVGNYIQSSYDTCYEEVHADN